MIEGIKIGGFFNAGQDCTSATRVIAGPRIHDRLVKDLVPAVESLKVGDPAAADTDMGPLVSEEQLERVSGFVERARKAGAEVATGGARIKRPGSWYEPTIVLPPGPEAEIVKREVFGPVVTIQRFSDEDEALEWAKRIPFQEGDVEIRQVFEAEDFGAEFTPELRQQEARQRAAIEKNKQRSGK